MTSISSFYNRLNKIGIKVELIGNYPWVYLDKINGKKVEGLYEGNHGFTVFFKQIRPGAPDRMTDMTIIFDKIRETLCQ